MSSIKAPVRPPRGGRTVQLLRVVRMAEDREMRIYLAETRLYGPTILLRPHLREQDGNWRALGKSAHFSRQTADDLAAALDEAVSILPETAPAH